MRRASFAALLTFALAGCTHSAGVYQVDPLKPEEGTPAPPPVAWAGDPVVPLVAYLVDKATDRSRVLAGRCVCHSEGTNIDIVCPEVTVTVSDEKGHALSDIKTRDAFAFRVQQGIPYRLALASEKIRLETGSERVAYGGEEVVLRLLLVPKGL